ncbi:integrase (plasmid) [Sinorhizobium medicae]|nr:integrase [Sinorhizobium medicae]
MIASAAATFTAQERDLRPVLASAPLKPGFARDALSRYGDPSWDLGSAVFRENARRCHVTVHFGSVEDASVREALRELLYARLNVDIAGHRKKLPPGSVRQAFNRARRFFEFVREELGAIDLQRVDQQLLDQYARYLRADRSRRPVIVAQLLEVPSDLYTYRDHLPSGGLPFEPWAGSAPARVAGYRHVRENCTPRIPEDIISPLLAWSIRYVTEFAPDIFTAREELERLESHCAGLIRADQPLDHRERRDRQRKRLLDYFDRLRSEGRGVPIWGTAHNGLTLQHPATGEVTPPVNSHLLHLHIGIDARAESRMHIQLASGAPDLIDAALRELGVEAGGMDTSISVLPETGKPWRPRFDAKTLAEEERMLQSAAYILCAYLTGMRDCEVQAMQRGCLALTRSEDGMIMRHRVRSVAYKGKSSQGEPAEWVTIEPVAKAIEVLERLSYRAASVRGLTTLWPVLLARPVCKDHLSAEIVRQLNSFRDHLNDLFGTPDTPAVPNGPGDQPWRITTRQFRRTIAWHIANRPFGTIAGMIQYKHASVAAFEGYAGFSRSGFRVEIENQRSLGQLDDLLTYFDERQAGATLSGPGAARITKTLDGISVELGPLPAMIADRSRLRTMLASLARTLHVGVLADCFFDPGTAVCLKQVTGADNKMPLTALCQPTRCPNACITSRHRPAWAHSADDASSLLREKRLSPLQRTILKQDLERIEEVLDSIDRDTNLGGSEVG